MQREKNGDDDELSELRKQYTSDEEAPPSPTRDIYQHDSSPNEEDDQQSIYPPLSRNVSRR